MALNANKIRQNALRADLSRRQQGFKSPWGRQLNTKWSSANLAAFFVAALQGSCPEHRDIPVWQRGL